MRYLALVGDTDLADCRLLRKGAVATDDLPMALLVPTAAATDASTVAAVVAAAAPAKASAIGFAAATRALAAWTAADPSASATPASEGHWEDEH